MMFAAVLLFSAIGDIPANVTAYFDAEEKAHAQQLDDMKEKIRGLKNAILNSPTGPDKRKYGEELKAAEKLLKQLPHDNRPLVIMPMKPRDGTIAVIRDAKVDKVIDKKNALVRLKFTYIVNDGGSEPNTALLRREETSSGFVIADHDTKEFKEDAVIQLHDTFEITGTKKVSGREYPVARRIDVSQWKEEYAKLVKQKKLK